jgi:hypothetical protein
LIFSALMKSGQWWAISVIQAEYMQCLMGERCRKSFASCPATACHQSSTIYFCTYTFSSNVSYGRGSDCLLLTRAYFLCVGVGKGSKGNASLALGDASYIALIVERVHPCWYTLLQMVILLRSPYMMTLPLQEDRLLICR